MAGRKYGSVASPGGGRRPDAKSSGAAEPGGRAAEMMMNALHLFAEKDYAAVTTHDIAAACGVNHSLIYYYFKSKQQLFEASVEHFVLDMLRDYEVIAAKHHSDPVSLLDDWFEINIRLAPSLRKLVKVMFDYAGPRGRSVSVDAAIRKFYRQERKIISSGIRQGVRLGIFAPVDPDAITAFVSTHLDGIFFGSMMRKEVDLAERMHQLRRILLQLLAPARAGSRRTSAPLRSR